VLDAATCAASAALLFLWLGRERHRPAHRDAAARAPGRSPWRDPLFLAGLGLTFAMAIVFFQLSSTFPLYLLRVDGYSTATVGIVLGINTISIVLFEMALVHRVDGLDRLRVIGAGSLLLGLGFGLTPLGSSLAWVALTVLVWTVGEMLSLPLLGSFVADRA